MPRGAHVGKATEAYALDLQPRSLSVRALLNVVLRPILIVLSALAIAPVSRSTVPVDVRFELSVPPSELVQDDLRFREFAGRVEREVERLLEVPAALDDPAVLGRLLSTRVHLAHYFADDDKAVVTAAWIRSLQSRPADRAFAGLTTLAAVATRRALPGCAPHERLYRETFRSELSRRLGDLPFGSEIVAMLQQQRAKTAAITEAALLAEAREAIESARSQTGSCGLEGADRLVRIRHRLVAILPVRDDILAALDGAISERSGR